MKEDTTAIPEDNNLSEQMIGAEVYNGNELLFRGGVLDATDTYWLYNEDGTINNVVISYVDNNGIERDENGNVIDSIEPSAATILELMNNPKLTHKGNWIAWFGAVSICVFNALFIVYADELFRVNLAFQIRNVDNVEPSDWEIAGRYIGWTVLAVMALGLFIVGLQ